MSESCASCSYAKPRDEYDMAAYYCRRYPPMVVSGSGHAVAPVMLAGDWCGEYVAGVATTAPVNTAVPYAQQSGELVTCTMGTWDGEPTGYAYQWVSDGTTNIGTGTAQYTVTVDDVGHTLTCVVTATNAIGSTMAPPSNGVVVTSPAGARR